MKKGSHESKSHTLYAFEQVYTATFSILHLYPAIHSCRNQSKPCRFFLYAFAAVMYLFVQATSPFLCIRLDSAWIFLPEAWTKPVKTLCLCGSLNFVLL